MKTIPLLLSGTAFWLGWAALPAQAQPIPGPAYVRSTVGPPWGVSANETAMDRVFGAGQWRDLRFESLSVPQFLSESTFIFMEGSDGGAQSLENFLTAHLAEIENWVSAGGVLFLNAGPNVGDGMNLGFGVTLLYPDYSSSTHPANNLHPLFQGPFVPVGTSWNGSIGHATVSGPGITPLIVSAEHGRFVLAERAFGSGWVLFGGMTTDNFHSPQPEAQNLRANILAYANEQIVPPTNQPPEILTQPVSQAVLVGQTVTLRATARGSRPLNLQWHFNGQPLPGATNTSLVLSGVTTNQAGGYKLVASNALGVATSERATLTVSLQGPRITLQPVSRSVLAGEDVTFSVLASGGPLFYQWRFNATGAAGGVDLPGATNATLLLAAVATNNAGTYQVAVSNLLGYVTSAPATLAVNQFAPTILSEPSDQAVQAGDSIQFYVGANGAPPPVYQWRFKGADLPGETNAALFLANVTTNQAGAYSAMVSNSVGSVTSRAAMLTVNEFPPGIFSQPFNQTVSAGTDVSFFVGANGSPPLTFQWRLNGTNLPGATNATLFLPSVHPNRAGTYTVRVSNHLGFVISQPAVLTVFGGAPPVITTQPANFTLLAGGSATLTVTATGQPAPNYQWRFNGVDLPGATLSFLALVDVATNQAGNYTAVASNMFGVATSRVAVVTVNRQAPIISTQPASRTVEAGSTVNFNVVASGGPPPVYQWLFNGGALPGARSSSLLLSNVFTNQAGIYSVIVSNEVGAVLSAPATLTVNGSAPIITTQPASRTVLDGSNATFVVSATGIPQVSFQWRFHATGAAGGVDLPNQTSSVLTLASVSTNAAGEYTVVVRNLLGTVVSDPAILTVTQQAPVITAQTTNRTVVVGANAIFQVLAVAGPRPTYQWQRDGVNISGATGSSLVLSNVSRADEGNYVAVVSNPLGSVSSQPMRLTVVYQPPVITGNPTNRSVQAGGTASFTVTATGSVPRFYQWRFNGADLPGATNQTLVLTAVMTNQAGGYSVVVTNFGGAATSGVATLTVTVQPPAITTQPANRTVPGGTNVTFTVVANGAPPPTYQWRHNGADLAGATNAQLMLTSVGTNHAGGYSAVVSNPFGSVTSRVATLTVIVQPTVITVQPADRTVRPGGSVTFSVGVSGTPPLLYQWDFNGENIPGATNATLTLTGVTLDNEGSYRVTISGAGGTAVSRKADLTIREPASGDFRINALLASNSRLVEHGFVTGDDRGGIAASSTRIFYSGDNQTAGFALSDLSGGTGVGRIFDALVSDLNSETVYSLGDGANPLSGGGVVTTLIELDGATGQPTTNVITLSEPISMQGGSGLFAGYDQIALFNGARVYTIEVASGLVIDHGPFSMPPHSQCENWAFWGVAEQIDGELHLAYVRDPQNIARVRVTDGVVETIATFLNLSDMCSFTMSLPLNRWYFHHEGGSQFGGGDESIGYADATWEVALPGPPIIRTQPRSITAVAGRAAQLSVTASGALPLSYQWQFNGEDIVGATNPVFRLAQVNTNDAGSYRVLVSNPLGVATSDSATLTVIVRTNEINVLLIWDVLNANTTSLQNALEAAGIVVELSATSETGYDGTNPGLDDFSAVIHLNGATYESQMPVAGQTALVQFVRDGGGYLGSEWNAFEISQGRMTAMRDLVLFDRVDQGLDGLNTWEIVPAQADHPLLANIPPTFSFRAAVNFGPQHVFAAEPSTVLMRDPSGHDAVAVREFGNGRIVGFEHAGNYDLGNGPYSTLSDPNVQQLYIDGVLWAAGGSIPSLPPSVSIPPTDRTVAPGRTATFRVGARGSRPLSYQWRFNGANLSGATNATLAVTNAALDQAGSYAVVVTNAFGSITSAPAVLTISEITTVAVFDDPLYVDTAGGSESESDTLQASLQFLGYGITTFTNIETAATAANLVLVFPELEAGYLPGNLDEAARAALAEFVETGGSMILHGVPQAPGWSADLLNDVFDFGVQEVQEAEGLSFTRTAQANGTAFAANAASLPANRGSTSLSTGSLPPGARSIYEESGRSLVAVLPHGLGRIIFLGWDWNNALPLGDADNGWLDVLNSAMAEAGGPSPGTNRPPVIAVQPASRTVLRGASVTFRVAAGGSQPLTYQWQFNGLNLPGATNAILVLADVSLSQSGNYAAVVSNPFGMVTSEAAFLSVIDAPANAAFRITSLTANNSRVADHESLTGDDRGGIAVSDSQVFYTGDSSTARFALGDLSGGTSLERQYDAMVSNLRTEKVYSLAEGTTPISAGGGAVTSLIEIDGATGELTANTIALSTPINISEPAGIFAGYDQVVLLTQGRAYSIHLPTGFVTDLGPMAMPNLQGCESWAYWGVAENFDGAVHVVYVRDGQNIVRARVPDGATEVLATFESLSDMCSFTLSLSLNRWYFHHEGGSQFGGSSETIGFADATWELPVPPLPPTITQPPQDVDGLWGGSAQFQVVATGPLLSYQWRFLPPAGLQACRPAGVMPGETRAALLLTNIQACDAGGYAVVVSNPFGSVTSAPVTLTVTALAPVVTTPPASQSAVLGVDVLFTAEITAAPAPTLQWFFNNAALPGETNATLLLTNVTMSAAGSYRIVADNFAGSAISPVATLTILPQVPLPVALDTPGQEWTTGGDALWTGQPFTAHDGVDAAQSGFLFDDEVSWLQTTVTGPGQVSFWWKVSSEPGYDFAQFTIGGVSQAAISGEAAWQQRAINFPAGPQTLRWAYVKDGSFHEGADRAWLDEVRFETAPRILTQPANQFAFRGSNVTFTVVASGEPAPTYQWQFNGANLVHATNASLTLSGVTTNHAGTYSVVVSNRHGSVRSSNAVLTIASAVAPVLINFDEVAAPCGFGETTALTNRYAALGVIFEGPGGRDGGAILNECGSFGVSGYSRSNFLGFNITGGLSNGGIPRGPETIRLTLPATRVQMSAGSRFGGALFNLAAYDTGGFQVAAQTINLSSEMQLVQVEADEIAKIIFTCTADYFVVDDIRVNFSVPGVAPGITSQPTNQVVAAGGTATLVVTATGSAPLSYQWRINGADIAGATNAMLSLANVLPANAGQYTVVVSNEFGVVTSEPATLTVITQAPVITVQPASQAVLGGGSVALSVAATGVPAPTYQWRLDGADIPGATNATLALNNVTEADAGTYKVIVRNLAGTATSLPARLTVNILPPQITLQPASQSVLRGTNATFTVAATGAPAPAYQWRFNDADLAGETSASLTIRQPTAANAGRYTVRVSNSGGTVTSLAAVLTVLESIALAEALDMPGLFWRSGGAMPWFGQPMTSHDGADAGRSGGAGDSHESWLETTVTGPGTVGFWWKVSSELGFDRLNFSAGGLPLASVSGETEWRALSFPLPDGPQTLRWSYTKDGSARDGADAGWVDQVIVTTTPALIVHAVIVGADVRISFPSAPGRHYRIERADDLTDPQWQPVGGAENILGTGLTLEAVDAGGAEFEQRFYRVRLLQ